MIEAATILFVEADSSLRESRSAVLKSSCYNAASVSPQAAEMLLRSQRFDLVVLSATSETRLFDLADGADVLILDGLTHPSELIWLVSERLNRGRGNYEVRPMSTNSVGCVEHQRLQLAFDHADRVWERNRFVNVRPINIGKLTLEESAELRDRTLSNRNVAANELYIHLRMCDTCRAGKK